MVVDARISGCAAKLAALERRVVVRLAMLLGQSKVDRVQHVALRAHSHEEVVRLDVAVQVPLAVDVREPHEGLVREQQHRLEREAPPAVVEQVLERRAEQLVGQHVKVVLGAAPEYLGDADAASERGVDIGFVPEDARVFAHVHQLESDLLACLEIGAYGCE